MIKISIHNCCLAVKVIKRKIIVGTLSYFSIFFITTVSGQIKGIAVKLINQMYGRQKYRQKWLGPIGAIRT